MQALLRLRNSKDHDKLTAHCGSSRTREAEGVEVYSDGDLRIRGQSKGYARLRVHSNIT